MKGKITALLMTACLLTASLTGCGNTETTGSTSNTQNDAQSTAGTQNTAENEDMAEITMTFMSMSSIPTGLQAVEDAINEITEAEINTHVTLDMIEIGSYEQQINLKMSSQEPFDLMVTMPYGTASYNIMIPQGQLLEISGLLEEYGQGILDTVGDFICGTETSDGIYGVTTWRSLVTNPYLIMRTDVLEDLGLLEKAQNMTSLSEYEEILQAVKESDKWNYLAGIVASDQVGTCLGLGGSYMGESNFEDFKVYDQLGDTNKIIAINPDGSDPTVVNNFATEDYKNIYRLMKDWYDKGYVYGDVTTQTDRGESYIKSNVAFSLFCQSEIGVETSKEVACGMPVTCVQLDSIPVSTSSTAKFVWAVPSSSKEPEAAIKFLNMMYTDSRIANLLAWGIEGVHYQVKDGVAYFMDGQDANTCEYHTVDYIYGNQFLVYPWEGQTADFREIAQEQMDNAEPSAYLGFAADTSSISAEVSAVSNVIAEYLPSIDSGIATEEDYNNFLEKLEASGISKIIETYQTQLDEWLANQQ